MRDVIVNAQRDLPYASCRAAKSLHYHQKNFLRAITLLIQEMGIIGTMLKRTFGVAFVMCASMMVVQPAIPQTFTTLHSFSGPDGLFPLATLLQATDGNLYGTTLTGGPNNNNGTVFSITPNGVMKTLQTFDGTGHSELYDGLVQATDGAFYGATLSEASNDYGAVFRISPQNKSDLCARV